MSQQHFLLVLKKNCIKFYLVDAPSSFKSQLFSDLLPHALVRDPGMTSEFVNDPEETIEVDLASVDHRGPVDWSPTVLHMLVQFRNL
jgi:hypothetical protein